MPAQSNPDAPAFPPLAGQSEVSMHGMTKREYAMVQLFASGRYQHHADAWREADLLLNADPRDTQAISADEELRTARFEKHQAAQAFAAVVDAAFPEGLAEIETAKRVAATAERIRELRMKATTVPGPRVTLPFSTGETEALRARVAELEQQLATMKSAHAAEQALRRGEVPQDEADLSYLVTSAWANAQGPKPVEVAR